MILARHGIGKGVLRGALFLFWERVWGKKLFPQRSKAEVICGEVSMASGGDGLSMMAGRICARNYRGCLNASRCSTLDILPIRPLRARSGKPSGLSFHHSMRTPACFHLGHEHKRRRTCRHIAPGETRGALRPARRVLAQFGRVHRPRLPLEIETWSLRRFQRWLDCRHRDGRRKIGVLSHHPGRPKTQLAHLGNKGTAPSYRKADRRNPWRVSDHLFPPLCSQSL